jgi:sulfate adenylyltransferase subunit 1 (EFTu-like GTPase family)
LQTLISFNVDILRFITAGSVDDGKSTLIGRLLFDSKSILIDQMEALEKQSRNKEDGEIDLATAAQTHRPPWGKRAHAPVRRV